MTSTPKDNEEGSTETKKSEIQTEKNKKIQKPRNNKA